MEKLIKFVTSENFILTIVIVVVGVILFMLLNTCSKKILKKNASKLKEGTRRNTAFHKIVTATKYLLILLMVLAIFQVNGINLGSLIASIGLVSAVAAYALQDVFKDLLMGEHILTDRFYKVGEVIKYNGYEGVVLSFNLRTTVIKDIVTDEVVHISNRNILEVAKPPGYFDIDLPLAYEDDYKYIHEVLGKVAKEISRLDLVKACKYLGTQRFADSAIIYKIRVYHNTPTKKIETWRAAIKIIQESLDEANLTMPYTQIEVHNK